MNVVTETGSREEAEDLRPTVALAKALTEIERGGRGLPRPSGTEPAVVGLVGAPGVGKSTLISALVARARARGERVVVLAVDPSSPVTGGALLGDRIRMARHATDPGVFIRSFASRGHPGGLAAAVPAAVNTALALGWDRVFIEPVGGGQNDIDVAASADRVVLVMSPESGDDIQTLKAGILEIADAIAINKADRPGAETLRRFLKSQLRGPNSRSIVLVSAAEEAGLDELDLLTRVADERSTERRQAAALSAVLNDAAVRLRDRLADVELRARVLERELAGDRAGAVDAVLGQVCHE